MPEQSPLTGAVFISYGSQDAAAAVRICEALRAAGVEVWFDQSELRGGDSWDAQIKKHIHDCAIFIPVISAHTNARAEGYFRGEWNLATRRLLNMAHDAAFLVPVVVDGTREADARVPEEFLRAQWTWLPGGETPPAFAQRVRQLLGGESAALPVAQSAAVRRIDPNFQRVASARPWRWFAGNRGRHRAWGVELALIALLLVLGGGAFWFYQSASEPVARKLASTTASPAVAVAPHEKSIAVLPFVDLSANKDQEYFSDGISEELLNLLAKIPQLRVISRTSAFSFKGQNVEMPEIAKRLNVAHILEGSVRKFGNQVRITAQLIDARSDTHVWSETYDRTLDDIFVVQDEIAGAVVKRLQVTLLGTEVPGRAKQQISEAYDLVLQGRYFLVQGSQEKVERSIDYFRQALKVDSGYASAWEGLSRAYANQADLGFVPAAEGNRRAREMAKKALALDPQLADAHLAMAWIQSGYDWDWEAADTSYRKALALEPGNARILRHVAAQAAILGQWDKAINTTKKAIERDPLRPGLYHNLGYYLQAANRDTESESAFRKALELDPGGAFRHVLLGRSLLLQGDAEAALLEIQQETEPIWRLSGLPPVYYALGRRSESDAALETLKKKHGGEMAFQIAEIHAFRGEADLAFKWLDRAYDQRDGGAAEIKGSRMFRTLADDPRYKAFLRKMKLPE